MKPVLPFLIHGYRVENPEDGIGRLRTMFEVHGLDVEMFRCGRLTLADVWFADNNIAAALLSCIEQASRHYTVVPIGHSNGCALIYLAAKLQAKRNEQWFDSAVYLSPALGRKMAAPLRRVDVFHSRHDHTVGLARWIPFHIWGDMGRVGYRGKDASHFNTDCADMIQGVVAHSAWWERDPLLFLRDRLANPFAARHGLTGGTPSAPLGWFGLP